MANENEIPIELTVETKDAKKSVNDFEKTLSKSTTNMAALFTGLGAAIAAGVAFLVGREVINGIKDITKEASEADQNVRNLATAFALTGEFSDDAVSSFEAFAAQIQKTTTLTDDAVLKAAALAKTFGLTNEQAQKVTKAAVDLSAATGKDLNASVEALSATYNGNIGKLGKASAAVKTLTDDQLKNGAAVDLLSKKFEGFAEQSAKSFEGSLIKAGNQFGEIFEGLGKIITQNPVVIALLDKMAEAFAFVAEVVDQNKESLTTLLSQALKSLVAALPGVIRSLGTFVEVTGEVINVVGFLAKGLIAVVAGLTEFTKPIRDLQNIIGNALLGSFSKFIAGILEIAKVVPGVSSALKGMGINLDDITNTVQEFADGRIDDALKLDTSVSDSYQKFADKSSQAIFDFIDGSQDSIKKFSKKVKDGAESFADFTTQSTKGLLELDEGAVKVTKGITNFTKEVDKSADAFKRLEFLKGSFDKIKNNAEALRLEIDKQTLSAKRLAEVEFERGTQSISNAVEELALQGKLSDENLKLLEQYAALIVKKKQLADEKLKLGDLTISEFAAAFSEGFDRLKETLSNFDASDIDLSDVADSFIARIQKGFEDLTVSDVGVGIASVVDKALSGKGGALAALQGAGAAVASAFLGPEFGQLASSIVGKLAAGPDQTKQFVSEFVDALPELVQAILEALPEVIITLIEKVLTVEYLTRLGVAIGKGLLTIATRLGTELRDAIVEAGRYLVTAIGNGLNNAFSQGATRISAGISGAFAAAGAQIYGSIVSAFQSVFGTLYGTIVGAFNSIFGSLYSTIVGAFQSIFGGLYSTIVQSFSDAVENFKNKLGDAAGSLRDEFFKPVNRLIDFLNNFKFPDITGGNAGPGGSGIISGKIGGAIGQGASRIGLASGALVPPGFEGDKFGPVNLNSGELVLPPNISSGLIDLINQPQQSDSSGLLLATILNKILAVLESPQQVSTQVVINGRELANTILDLQRNNARLSA